jgi:hypothetical protein
MAEGLSCSISGLINLRDMIETIATEIVSLWPNLQELKFGFGMGGVDAPSEVETRQTLGRTIQFCQKVGWTDLENQARRLLDRAIAGQSGDPMSTLAEDLQRAFEEKCNRLNLAVIEERDNDLLKNASLCLCDGNLNANLSISEEELNLAGRALAFGLSTAAVSHSMRSVEAGLHALTKALAITFPGPVQLQDWINLTDKLQAELSKWQNRTRSPQKMEQQKWLAELLLPADCFRLAWRNHVAHAREKYEEQEARNVLINVGRYLKKLSDGLEKAVT